MLAPTLVKARQQSAAIGAQYKPHSRVSVIPHVPIVNVFPSRAAVVRLAGGQPTDIAALQFDETDREKLVSDHQDDVVECDLRVGGPGGTIGDVGQSFL
jgi:hypothetical protein